jgi:hypothetical protein
VQRQGGTIAISFVVPGGNTDGSTPADLARVDVYALTASPPVNPDDIVRRGTRIGSVLVNPPPDPDTPEGQPAKPAAPPIPGAVDQVATARLSEPFEASDASDPSEIRSYVAVGFNKRGRRGAYSAQAAVPIGPAPEPPGKPEVTWDETSITIRWPAATPPDADSTLTYRVYVPGDRPLRLTEKPLDETSFVDQRIEWGAERCYVVRSVATIETLSLESEASPSTCVTLVDTFAPAAPEGLTVVAAEGAMNLIWNPNRESDLAGYVLWRAIPQDANLVSITPSPVTETTFRDAVPGGTRVAYALQAVDKAGNVSPMSARVEETAR